MEKSSKQNMQDEIIEHLSAKSLDLKNELEKSKAQIKKYENASTPPSKRHPAHNAEQPADAKPKRRRGGQKGAL